METKALVCVNGFYIGDPTKVVKEDVDVEKDEGCIVVTVTPAEDGFIKGSAATLIGDEAFDLEPSKDNKLAILPLEKCDSEKYRELEKDVKKSHIILNRYESIIKATIDDNYIRLNCTRKVDGQGMFLAIPLK